MAGLVLEVGKRYVRRDGSITQPLIADQYKCLVDRGCLEMGGDLYHEIGGNGQIPGLSEHHPLSLIREVPAPVAAVPAPDAQEPKHDPARGFKSVDEALAHINKGTPSINSTDGTHPTEVTAQKAIDALARSLQQTPDSLPLSRACSLAQLPDTVFAARMGWVR